MRPTETRKMKSRGLALNTIGRPSGFTEGSKEGLTGIFKRRRELTSSLAFSACPTVPGSPTATELVPKSLGSVWSLEDREEGSGPGDSWGAKSGGEQALGRVPMPSL